MYGIPVSHSGGIKPFTIIINSAGTVDDFITSVSIYIAYTKIVIALTCISFISGSVTIENPTLL